MAIGAPIGNTNAAKGKVIGDAMRKLLVQNPDKLSKALEAQLSQAANGDIGSIQFIRDTVDGKPHQSTDVSISGNLQDALAAIQPVQVPDDPQ